MTRAQATMRTVYYARSRTDQNHYHEVVNCRGRWACQCAHNSKGHKECDHIKDAKAGRLRVAKLKIDEAEMAFAPLPKATRARTSAQTADLTAMLDV